MAMDPSHAASQVGCRDPACSVTLAVEGGAIIGALSMETMLD